MRCWLKPAPGQGHEAVLVFSGGREVAVRLSRPLSYGPALLTLAGDSLEILDQTGEKAEADVLADEALIGLLLDWEETGEPRGPAFPVEVVQWLTLLLGKEERCG